MENVDMMALAGLLHDIGKFGQRAEIYKQKSSIYKNKEYKYTHGAYTAQILYELGFNLGDDMSDNAAMHHNPTSDEQWIIAAADRMASGFEREIFEDYNSADSEGFKQQRLWHIFDETKQYKIDKLSPENIFAESEKAVKNEYDALWSSFEEDMHKIKKEGNSLNDSFTIDYLLKKYTTFIPSSTSFQKGDFKAVKANIPLYEHSKATAIFTSVLYKLKEQGNDNIVNYYKDKSGDINHEDMLLIAGDFFAIQKFIFNDVAASKASKILRAKSAYIQLFTKIVAFYIVEELGLSYQSIISTSAGKFEILGVNDDGTKQKLHKIQQKLNDFFIKKYFGETGIGVSFVPCSLSDFIVKDQYKESLRKRVDKAVEKAKFQKFDLLGSEAVLSIDVGIDNQNLCPLCSKRKIVSDESCQDCGNFVKIGQELAKKPYLVITKDKTDVEIFGGFYIKFVTDPKVFKNSVAIFDISNDEAFNGYAKWELGSYVATHDEEVVTFEDLAKKSCQDCLDKDGNQVGVKALMALKGDVDFMGKYIKDSEVTNSFARFNFFSRMVDYFFSVYVPHLMREEYPDTYTVFAGGDDLFILGAWDQVIDLAKEIQERFKTFCEKKMSFSVGMIMTKPNKPINFVADVSERALEEAKDYKSEQDFKDKEKNAITLFGQTIGFNEYQEDMLKDFKVVKGMAEKYPDVFNTAFWYRLLEFCDMRENLNSQDVDIKNAMWRSKVSYMFKRNIISKHKNENFDEVIKQINENIETYGATFKMVVSEEIYKRRD